MVRTERTRSSPPESLSRTAPRVVSFAGMGTAACAQRAVRRHAVAASPFIVAAYSPHVTVALMDLHVGGIRTLRPMEEGNGVFREEADSGAASSLRPVLGGMRSICTPLSSS